MRKESMNKKKRSRLELLCIISISLSILLLLFLLLTIILFDYRIRKLEGENSSYNYTSETLPEDMNYITKKQDEKIESIDFSEINESDDIKNINDLTWATAEYNGITFRYPAYGTIGKKGFFDEYNCEYYMEIDNAEIVHDNSGYSFILEGTSYYDNIPNVSFTEYHSTYGETGTEKPIHMTCTVGERFSEKSAILISNSANNPITKVEIKIEP